MVSNLNITGNKAIPLRVIVTQRYALFSVKDRPSKAFSLKICKQKGIFKVHISVGVILTETWKEKMIKTGCVERRYQKSYWYQWRYSTFLVSICLGVGLQSSPALKQTCNSFKINGRFESDPEISKKPRKASVWYKMPSYFFAFAAEEKRSSCWILRSRVCIKGQIMQQQDRARLPQGNSCWELTVKAGQIFSLEYWAFLGWTRWWNFRS